MRKLIYIGKNNQGIIVKTASYEEMNQWKNEGFTFTEHMEEVKKEETKEQKEKRLARIEKMKKIREKRLTK